MLKTIDFYKSDASKVFSIDLLNIMNFGKNLMIKISSICNELNLLIDIHLNEINNLSDSEINKLFKFWEEINLLNNCVVHDFLTSKKSIQSHISKYKILKLIKYSELLDIENIDLDFTRNAVTNDVNVVEDVIAVKRSVRNLVQTNFYERPFNPELGCGVRELLFEPFTPMTKVFLERKIEEVLINYEPRVEVQNIAVDDDQDRNRLVVDIYFYVVGVPGPQVVQTFLQRVR